MTKHSGIPLSKLPRHLQDQVGRALYPKTMASQARTGPTARELAPVGTLPLPAAPSPIKGRSGGPYPLMLWLDYRVPSLNTVLGHNRWAVVKMKQTAKEALCAALSVMGKYPQNPAGRMHVLITSYLIRPRDTDNPVPKFLIDEMRYCGLLRDDDPGCMFHTMNPEVRVSKRKLEGTRVLLCEALP